MTNFTSINDLNTAISIKVVPKTREKVEYITIHRCSTKFKIRSCFLMNRNREYVSLETKFCFVCVSLIVTPSKLSRPLCSGTTLIEIAVCLKPAAHVQELSAQQKSLVTTGVSKLPQCATTFQKLLTRAR